MKTPLSKETAVTGCLYSFVVIVIFTLLSIMLFSCAAPEKLTECSPKDRYIMAIEGNWLIVTDGCGRPAPKIRAKNFPNAKVGGWLICEDYLRASK